jgi:hypothetical protein
MHGIYSSKPTSPENLNQMNLVMHVITGDTATAMESQSKWTIQS